MPKGGATDFSGGGSLLWRPLPFPNLHPQALDCSRTQISSNLGVYACIEKMEGWPYVSEGVCFDGRRMFDS